MAWRQGPRTFFLLGLCWVLLALLVLVLFLLLFLLLLLLLPLLLRDKEPGQCLECRLFPP